MPLSSEDIVQLRLQNQHISAPQAVTVPEIVRWLGAVQAQDFGGAKWGLGLRLVGAQEAQVEQAFTEGQILRTHLLRPTWHFIVPEDIRWLLTLTAPRVRTAMGSTNRQLGIDDDLVQQCSRSIEKALRGGRQLTREELRQAMQADGLEPGDGQRLSNLVMRAELDGLICSGPRRGKQFTYMLLEERVPPGKRLEREEALAELASRFFLSRGPATVQDFAHWSGLTLTDARTGLEAVKHQLQAEAVAGQTYWLPVNTPEIHADGACTHLMSVYDEYISGYQDRSAMVDPSYVEILRGLGNGLVNIIVLEGQVVGAWRRIERGRALEIELNCFRPFDAHEQAAVEAAVEQYGRFWEQEVRVR